MSGPVGMAGWTVAWTVVGEAVAVAVAVAVPGTAVAVGAGTEGPPAAREGAAPREATCCMTSARMSATMTTPATIMGQTSGRGFDGSRGWAGVGHWRAPDEAPAGTG